MHKIMGLRWALALVVLVAAGGCTKSKEPAATPAPEAKAKTLQIAIWSNYVTSEMLAEFEKQTGIKPVVSNYSSNEELLAKLQAGGSDYDVIVPSDYMVLGMTRLGLLHKIDRALVPNAANLDPKFMGKSYDPQNEYSLPFDWGTVGIAVNRNMYKGAPIKGWKDLFSRADLAGKFTLLDDVREVLAAALKSQGLSLNSRNPAEIKKAQAVIEGVKKKLKGFTSETSQALGNGELAVAHAYSTDAMLASSRTGGKIDYILPEEGGTLWVDNLAIPAGAPHPKEAHLFLDFMLDPARLAATVNRIFVAPTHLKVFDLLTPELKANKTLFPDAAALAKFEMMEDLGDDLKHWDRAWTEIKAGASE